MKLEHWTLDRFQPYDRNPRRNDEVVDKMVQSIAEYGFRMPVVVQSDGTVVDGHLRLKAAIAMELDQVPVVLADELNEQQVKAFRLLANRSANWAEWDTELLAIELTELDLDGFDVDLTGFSDDELELLLVEDDATPPQTDYQSPQLFTKPDATDYNRYTYGENYSDDDDEPDDDDHPERQNTPAIGGQYPLAIVLGFAEHKRWKAYKEAIGIKRDVPAFLKLLDSTGLE